MKRRKFLVKKTGDFANAWWTIVYQINLPHVGWKWFRWTQAWEEEEDAHQHLLPIFDVLKNDAPLSDHEFFTAPQRARRKNTCSQKPSK